MRRRASTHRWPNDPVRLGVNIMMADEVPQKSTWLLGKLLLFLSVVVPAVAIVSSFFAVFYPVRAVY